MISDLKNADLCYVKLPEVIYTYQHRSYVNPAWFISGEVSSSSGRGALRDDALVEFVVGRKGADMVVQSADVKWRSERCINYIGPCEYLLYTGL